ncbi:MAG: hypothetical protein IJT44_06210 [Clostridia bacterium]|nr:hypothetical protein [Clostridia bacterium]
MNPIAINRMLKTGQQKYSVPALNILCGKRIRHSDLKMSGNMEVFRCPYANRVCHYATGLSLRGWIRLWF